MSQTDTDQQPDEFGLTEPQAAKIREGLAEIVEAGRLMGSHEEESE